MFRERTKIKTILLTWSFILFTSNLLKIHGEDVILSEKQNMNFQNAVKTLLGFKDIPGKGAKVFSMGNPKNEAPKYMLDLYEKYRLGQMSMGNKAGNTVRSIKAQIEFLQGKEMFLFNLSSITSSEKIFGGELHIFKKKMKGRHAGEDVILQFHEISRTDITEIDTVVMAEKSHGWQVYDITPYLTKCLATPQRHPNIFAVSTAVKKEDGKSKQISLKKFIHHMSKPYLIAFSNDTQNITLDHISPHFNPVDLEAPIIDPEIGFQGFGGIPKEKHKKRNSRSTKDSEQDLSGFRFMSKIFNEERNKRSIQDNEIPEHPTDPIKTHKHYNLPDTNPEILKSRTESESRPTDSKLIPFPDEDKTPKRRKKNRRNRNKKRGSRKLPFIEDWENPVNSATVLNSGLLCSKQRLVLSFADIGWSDWIIAPSFFESNYCSGTCHFPMTTKLKPSNHATVQSLVNFIGIHSEVPAPCCVPESLSSVTLLYFDDDRNVVLRNYPDMTVQSCGCR